MTLTGYFAILVVVVAVLLVWQEVRRRDQLWREKVKWEAQVRMEKSYGEQIRVRLEDANLGGLYAINHFWSERRGYDLRISKPWPNPAPALCINVCASRVEIPAITISFEGGETLPPVPMTESGRDKAVKEALVFMAEHARIEA